MQRNEILKIFSDHEPFERYKLPHRAELFHYLWLTYAEKSPLVRDVQDVSQRQQRAAREAGLELTPEIADLEDERISELLDYFLCEIQNNLAFQMLISNEKLFRECQQQIRKKIKAEETVIITGKEDQPDTEKTKILMEQDDILKALNSKGVLAKLSEETAERIEKYRAKIYAQADEKKVGKRKFRPESV